MTIRAVLFDFDGVLADTENHHVAAWQRTLAALGWSISDEVAVRAAEIDDRDFLSELFWSRGIQDGDMDGWLSRKKELTLSLLQASPRVYPGVASLVSALKERAALAVVTGTTRGNVETVLNAAGLGSSFSLIVSKEDVARVKPAPDAYLLAIERLGLEADQAVALEDSPTGLKSASAAGIRTIAVSHRRAEGDWCKGHPYVKNLASTEDLLNLLAI